MLLILDPLELEVPQMTQPIHFMKDPTQAPAWMIATKAKIDAAAGLVQYYNGPASLAVLLVVQPLGDMY